MPLIPQNLSSLLTWPNPRGTALWDRSKLSPENLECGLPWVILESNMLRWDDTIEQERKVMRGGATSELMWTVPFMFEIARTEI